MIINNIPMPNGWSSTEITLFKSEGHRKLLSIMIIHNIPIIGPITVERSVRHWVRHTNKHTDKSLIEFIRSHSDYQAYSVKEWNKKQNSSAQ